MCFTKVVWLSYLNNCFIFRLLGDLVMWEPLAPSPVNDPSKSVNYDNVHVNLASHIGTLEGGASDKFFMCKSAIKDGMKSVLSVFWNCKGCIIYTVQKWSFPLRISSVNETKFAGFTNHLHLYCPNLPPSHKRGREITVEILTRSVQIMGNVTDLKFYLNH